MLIGVVAKRMIRTINGGSALADLPLAVSIHTQHENGEPPTIKVEGVAATRSLGIVEADVSTEESATHVHRILIASREVRLIDKYRIRTGHRRIKRPMADVFSPLRPTRKLYGIMILQPNEQKMGLVFKFSI